MFIYYRQDCGVEIEKTRQLQEHHSINFYKHHQISGKQLLIMSSFGINNYEFINHLVKLYVINQINQATKYCETD